METFGFRNATQIDIGVSIMNYQKFQTNYQKEMCYHNAFRVLFDFMTERDIAASYGYVLSTDGKRKVAVRHAWNRLGNLYFDVTMFANNENPIYVLNYTYLPIVEYSPRELLNAIETNGNNPCLPKTKKELYYIRKLKEKGFEVLE